MEGIATQKPGVREHGVLRLTRTTLPLIGPTVSLFKGVSLMNFARLCLLLLVALGSQARADLSYTPGSGQGNGNGVIPKIKVHGEIRDNDAAQFPSLLAVAKESARKLGFQIPNRAPLFIELDSRGGSIRAALSLGRQIRGANPLSTNVQSGASCVSACVMLLAGGTSRFVEGSIGIHRPYLDDDRAFTSEEQRRNYAAIEKDVKEYLVSVNVPTSLYDTMFRIPPEKVRYLNERELQTLGLNEDDPFQKEAGDAQNAQSAGLSKREYQRRQSVCARAKNMDEATECYKRLQVIPR